MMDQEKKPMLNLAHRDDLPMENVAELEKMFGEMYPGYKVVFAGDSAGGMSDEMKQKFEALERLHMERFANGKCIDCGEKMPNWPEGEMTEDFALAKGWSYFTQGEGESQHPIAWQCPACDAADDGSPKPIA